MRCPACNARVTAFNDWYTRWLDDPKKCPGCGLQLRPSRRAAKFLPLVFTLALLPGVAVAGLIVWSPAESAIPHLAAMFALPASLMIAISSYVAVWSCGQYQPAAPTANPTPTVSR